VAEMGRPEKVPAAVQARGEPPARLFHRRWRLFESKIAFARFQAELSAS